MALSLRCLARVLPVNWCLVFVVACFVFVPVLAKEVNIVFRKFVYIYVLLTDVDGGRISIYLLDSKQEGIYKKPTTDDNEFNVANNNINKIRNDGDIIINKQMNTDDNELKLHDSF